MRQANPYMRMDEKLSGIHPLRDDPDTMPYGGIRRETEEG